MRPRFAESQAEAAVAPPISNVMWKMLAATLVIAFSIWAGLEIVSLIP